MSTQKIRNIIVVLILTLSVAIAPAARSELIIEPSGMSGKIVIETKAANIQ